jgi:hypothetical protein
MACTTCLVCLVSTVSGCHKNTLERASACSRHKKNLSNLLFLDTNVSVSEYETRGTN